MRTSEQLRSRTRAAGMDYHLLVTDQPLDAALREYLSLRQARELMGFLAPWFLAGLAALGVPVFVHLLRRHVTIPRPVSSLMFFERGTQSSTRHRRLRYLLLFALRLALLLLLVLAFANPFVRRSAAEANGRLLLIVLDNSFSMRAGTRLADAKQQALAGAGREAAFAEGAGDGAGWAVAGADAADCRMQGNCVRRLRAFSRATGTQTSASWGEGCARWRRRCTRRSICICSAICSARLCRRTLPIWCCRRM